MLGLPPLVMGAGLRTLAASAGLWQNAGHPKVGEWKPVANEEHLARLRQGSLTWNEWRKRNGIKEPDLSEAKLRGADLREANLAGVNFGGADLGEANLLRAEVYLANLRGADLSEATLNRGNLGGAALSGADLSEAHLCGAQLFQANLFGADLSEADLDGADLREANLNGAVLRGANLREANLSYVNLSQANIAMAWLAGTIFGNVDLTGTSGLNECWHEGPCIIDIGTLLRSPNLPLAFLRGCGVPDNLVEYLPSLRSEVNQFYSCFISYSARDQVFAEWLRADLQNKGVRCWFAPHDLPIGAKTWDAIDEAIRLRDKLLLILSKASIDSEWVEDEVNKAYAEERSRKQVVLFPIRIDDAVMTTTEPWAVKLRDQRNLGDFQRWKKPTEYRKSLERLLRDLKASGTNS
jgi:uncharacterized protein YjbI with pentapeptide repeats